MRTLTIIAAFLSIVSATPAPMPDGTVGVPPATPTPCNDSLMPHVHIIGTPATTLVGGLQLSYDSATSGRATLTSSGISSLWDFSNGGVGVRPDCAPTLMWLNIDPSTVYFPPLYWNKTGQITTWSAGYGQNLVAISGPSQTYNSTETFLACKKLNVKAGPWYLFLLNTGLISPAQAPSLSQFDTKGCVKTRLTVESNIVPIR